jgi:histidinol phosphatase-like enzyme
MMTQHSFDEYHLLVDTINSTVINVLDAILICSTATTGQYAIAACRLGSKAERQVRALKEIKELL